MAGTSKDYAVEKIHQGPGDLWIVGSPPDDATVRLTLAADGTPDAGTHPASVSLGTLKEGITIVPAAKLTPIKVDQFGAPLEAVIVEEGMSMEATLSQAQEMALMQYCFPNTTYAAGAGYKQLTIGGKAVTVATFAVAMISATRADPTKYIVALMYKAYAEPGATWAITRAKPMETKVKFQALLVPTRTAGKQIGVVYVTE